LYDSNRLEIYLKSNYKLMIFSRPIIPFQLVLKMDPLKNYKVDKIQNPFSV
jgi:hypothetical protein